VGKLGEDLQLYLKHLQVRSVWNRQHQSLWCDQVLCLVDDRFPGQVRQSATLESLVVALGDNIKTLLSDVQSLKEGQEAMQSDIQSLKEGQETQAKEALRLRSDLLDVRKESVDNFIKSMGTKG